MAPVLCYISWQAIWSCSGGSRTVLYKLTGNMILFWWFLYWAIAYGIFNLKALSTTNAVLTVKALKYFRINHGDRRVFPIWNHHECLCQLFLLHLNTYVMGLRSFFKFFLVRGSTLDVIFWRYLQALVRCHCLAAPVQVIAGCHSCRRCTVSFFRRI